MAKRTFKNFVEQELGKFPHFLIYAVLEWVLIFMLFVDGFLAFFTNEFARFFELKIPCLLCTRIDHVLVHRTPDFYYNDSICESHKKDVSCLAFCHNHKKLSDINKMCESCLLSFATEKSSDCHTYKSLVGILHKDIELFVDNDQDHHVTLSSGRRDEMPQAEKISLHWCSCCGEPLKAKSKLKGKGSTSLTSQGPTPSPRAPFVNLRNEEHRNMVDLSRLRYADLKFPDNDSELNEVEDGLNSSHLARVEVKAASVPLLTEAEEIHEDRTPPFGRTNKFFGIPLTDSANASPKWVTRISRKSPLEKTESASDTTEGNAHNESDRDLILHHLKGQVKLDRKSLMALYMELDEERNASAIAANNAMAMITRVQAEKAAVQMEALQYQRMMEEQAEYDQEALQAATELLGKREDDIRALEAEIEEYRAKYGFLREEEEGFEESGDDDYRSQSFSSYTERSDYLTPTYCSIDGGTNGDFVHISPSLGEENGGEIPVRLQRGGRGGYLGRLQNLNKKAHIFSDDGISDNATPVDEETVGDSKVMRELLHLHERVKALEADGEISKNVSPAPQNDGNREKLLTEICDNLHKLRHFISSPFVGDDNDA
ncbi:probable myosin-binding protein 5 [Mercurialis annua]|uniref:probable myosin-binding protein 5 n=1 Tax=Mercurialis annua TaxID=3986 RepID=UPI00215F10D1|nr:probable myosin-binding protein 5 [Mercurialis annua]